VGFVRALDGRQTPTRMASWYRRCPWTAVVLRDYQAM